MIDAFIDGDAKETTEYDCAETTRGVFNAYAISFSTVFIECQGVQFTITDKATFTFVSTKWICLAVSLN